MGMFVGLVISALFVAGLIVFLFEYLFAREIVDRGVVEGAGGRIPGISDSLALLESSASDFYFDRYPLSIRLDGSNKRVTFLSYRKYREGTPVLVRRGKGRLFGSLFMIGVEPA